MTIMSVSASRHSSVFSIQSILGDIDNQKSSSEDKNTERKRKNSDVESEECNSCSQNQREDDHYENSQSRFHLGAFDCFTNDNLLRKLQYSHYGHYLSQEYMPRTQDEIRKYWHAGCEDGSNPFYMPLRLHNNFQLRGQGSNPDFLFPHLRKPKRVRTAFSPSQLLRLEHAFENNHYVVGQERKELAAGLALTETQVKVWFQNRRTKHKRIRAEDEMTKSLARSLEGRDRRDSRPYNTWDSESDIEV